MSRALAVRFAGVAAGSSTLERAFVGEVARNRPAKRHDGGGVVAHYPETDAEAKAIIVGLGHYEWDTHKVSGSFERNPYVITATIDGARHAIALPGRFGGVLKWLDTEERKRAA